MNKVSIKDFDINNGEGIRVSLWVAGCPHHCYKCHNSQYWDYTVGTEFTYKDMNLIIKCLETDISKDFSILGGEPLAPYNIEKVTEICKEVKNKYPYKNIWIWTGYDFNNIKDKDILKYIDILIDGKYIDSLHDDNLMWRGSSNQRIIDIKESLKQNKVVLYDV
jgi:anaerobic ribonucleoside-triphosphate reductase activating protein